ncbi:WXG100 family type VII secretion target [Nocardia brasiliensis]|uniref:WXG100 family type VII secretion target n=1 Tax=Nocardia brasiliensis TaxID=37326 RepID=UPI00245840DA|nr:WXG100 family type VII secretion target [Nocardia brasiliensis]
MKYGHGEIDTQVAVLQTVLSEMESNAASIRANRDKLMADFVGASADGYQTVMTKLNTDLAAYQATLGNLRVAIQNASNDMHTTDVGLGARFQA